MIAGLQKMTLLDYPGKVACTVFLQGCNFRCPFCHNSDLLPRSGEPLMTVEALLAFLNKRRGLLDAVCVSGGEPTLQPELENLLRSIKAMGYAVKLDTNGSRPEVLKRLAAEKLLDYVAMDVKSSPEGYGAAVGLSGYRLEAVEESLRFLISGEMDYELRTTVVAQLHDKDTILQMGQWLTGLVPGKKPTKIFLQSFVDRDSVLCAGLSAHEPRTMEDLAELLRPFSEQVAVRGI